MCDPLSIGLAVASTAVSVGAQAKAASDQNKYLRSQGLAADENYRQTVEAVQRDVGLQTDALMAQQMETIAAQKQQLQNISLDARAASSAYTASQAETGIEGRTVQLVHDQFQREVLNYSSAAQRNMTNYTAQLNREASAIYARGQSIINSGYPAPLPPYQSVNYASSIMNGVTQGIGMHLAFRQAGLVTPSFGATGGGTTTGGGGGLLGPAYTPPNPLSGVTFGAYGP
jgi:hypothetical protein